MKPLFCYVLLCLVALLPLSGQTAGMAMPTTSKTATMQMQSDHPAMADCMHHNNNSAKQATDTANHSCCDDNDANYISGSEFGCQHAGCQCDHNSSHTSIYLPVVNTTNSQAAVNQPYSARLAMVISGHRASLIRPPIDSLI